MPYAHLPVSQSGHCANRVVCSLCQDSSPVTWCKQKLQTMERATGCQDIPTFVANRQNPVWKIPNRFAHHYRSDPKWWSFSPGWTTNSAWRLPFAAGQESTCSSRRSIRLSYMEISNWPVVRTSSSEPEHTCSSRRFTSALSPGWSSAVKAPPARWHQAAST